MLFVLGILLAAIIGGTVYMLLEDYFNWYNGRPLTDPRAQAEKLAWSNPHLLDLLQDAGMLANG